MFKDITVGDMLTPDMIWPELGSTCILHLDEYLV